ncbi:unnamed protein product, partial [Laminaria digitata]
LQRGDKVEARYRARGTKFYKGRIARVNSDETFDIDYDDGEKEIGISEEHVRSLEQPSSSSGRGRAATTNDREDYDSGSGDVSPPLLEGDRIEGNFQGRGRYYKGRISRQNLDGSFNIDYDDGEKERGVSRGMVRPMMDANPRGAVVTGRRSSGSHHARGGGGGAGSSGGTRLQRGDRVEARYRGRGTKFYGGRVARVNSDATLDIDYDDGDKEIGIAEEHVREAA